jgi:membrane associated rhomboid family serine protease
VEPEAQPAVCPRHPDRPAPLGCARCGRPMCVEDAVEAPVGHHCIDCVRAGGSPSGGAGAARVTRAAVATIVVVHLVTLLDRGAALTAFGLIPLAVGSGQWWRLITSALLHGNIVHLAFNALLLLRLGEALERPLGHGRAAALLAAGAAGGSLGVVVMAWVTVSTGLATVPIVGRLVATSPSSISIGASGAVFGLMGALLVAHRARGLDPWRSEVGSLVVLNLVLTFLVPAISIGGHLGGFAAGWIAGRTLLSGHGGPAGRRRATRLVALGSLTLIAAGWWLARATLLVVLP